MLDRGWIKTFSVEIQRISYNNIIQELEVSCVSSVGKGKIKVKMHTLDIAPLRSESSPIRSAKVWHVFSRDFTVLLAHPHVHPQSE